jgi:hypothetical protein
LVRDLDAYEKAALTAALLSGGNRKKTKDLIDMKIKEKRKSLKGGTKVPDTLNPTGYNLNTTRQHDNEEIVTAFNACEGTHYSSAQRTALPGVQGIANTNSPHDLSRLRNCVGATFGIPGQGYRAAVPGAPPMPGPVTQAQGDKVAATPATYEKVITPDGTQPSGASGGSRKNKSRSLKSKISRLSLNKLGSSSRNMARKSSHRSTRRSTRRASTRKASRKASTRRNRK